MLVQLLLLFSALASMYTNVCAMKEHDIHAVSSSTQKLISLYQADLYQRVNRVSFAKFDELSIKSIDKENDFTKRMELFNELMYRYLKPEFGFYRGKTIKRLTGNNPAAPFYGRIDKGIEKKARNEVLLCKYLNRAYFIYAHAVKKDFKVKNSMITESGESIVIESKRTLEVQSTVKDIFERMLTYIDVAEDVDFKNDKNAQEVITKYSKSVYEKCFEKDSPCYVSPTSVMPFNAVKNFIYSDTK